MFNYEWQGVDELADRLADRVQLNGTRFDAVAGLAKGGLVPAVLLASRLSIQDVYGFNVEKDGDMRHVTTPTPSVLTNKEVLLVDDVTETGEGLWAVRRSLMGVSATVHTAVFYTTPETRYSVNFSLGQIATPPHFPWEGRRD